MKRRTLILLLGGASSGAMSVGTGAFSSVEAERGVEVNVVEDDEAYLGLEQVADVVPPGERTKALRVTNQFTSALNFKEVRVTDGDAEAINIGSVDSATLAPGDKAYVFVNAPETGVVDATLDFTGVTDNATVKKSLRLDISSVRVEFKGSNGSGKSGKGGGTVHVYGKFSSLEVRVNDSYTKHIDSGKNGKAVIQPNKGQIYKVVIGGTVYRRKDD
ncbi:hypothetical protein PM030_15310 [Halorubrum ezzemoulense]|uniref:hypothetical protein n=1 Tax=Halorubrum ezzemoulense TaxID=337243 RepID=UPI00232EB611|nr:hypothetical protein [Halorubrum ezzemoulense]MDB2283239.1 hypothetical protein [Halorubrum ezzemoulense]